MPKDKHRKGDRKKKGGKKTSQLAIRIEKAERDAFVELCETLDTSAAREIRRFMRDFVAAHAAPPAAPEGDDASEAMPAETAPPAGKRKAKGAAAPTGDAPADEPAPSGPRPRRSARAKPADASADG